MLTRHHHTAIAITALSTLLLIGCSTATSQSAHGPKPSTSQAAETSTPTPEVPPYYSEFDPELVAATVQPPCDFIPDEFFADLKLNVPERQDSSDNGHTVFVCSFRILNNQGTNMPGGHLFMFHWDRLDEQEVSNRFEIFRQEGPWIIANEYSITPTSTCTASISTKRGRLGVTRTQPNYDPKKQQSFCYEALEVIKKTADYLHYNAKVI